MKLVAFDIDSVIADTYDIMESALYKAFGIRFPKEEHSSFNFDIPGASTKEIVSVIDKCMLEDVNNALPLNNAMDVLRHIYSLSNKRPLLFVSARPKSCYDGTKTWLMKYLGPFIKFNVIFTENKPKTQILLDHGIEVFVDDRYKTIKELSSVIQQPLMFDHPWNRNRPVPKGANVIKDLSEVIDYLYDCNVPVSKMQMRY